MKNPLESEFWSERYQTGQTGWDLGAPSPNLQRLVRTQALPGARVLVPGCGRGHDAVAFAGAGFQVAGLDFAPEAIGAARQLAASRDVSVDWELGDLFAERPAWNEHFDVWAELTCFCAIDPVQRAAYVVQARRWLKPGGLLTGLIFTQLPAGGPPFNSSAEEIRACFERDFVIERIALSMDSIPARQGKELEVVFRRR